MKILVVEDDLALADVLAFTLRRAGFDVLAVYDGAAAAAAWQHAHPHLIILDLNLPHLDGMGLCRAIRSQSDVPIIMLTVRSGDADVVQGLEAGADDYVVKPFSPSQLVARVRFCAALTRLFCRSNWLLAACAWTVRAMKCIAWV